VVAARRLAAVGLRAGANTVLARARQSQLRGGANLELAIGQLGTPAGYLRQLGRQTWQNEADTAEGRREALAWVRDSLNFSLALEGDAGFAPALAAWLKAHPDDAPAGLEARVPALLDAARPLGSFAMIQPWRLLLIDAAFGLTNGGPLMLFLLVIWFWLRARGARLAALYARGFRSRRERLAAFMTFPLLRLRHTTWSYLTRHERFLLLVGGVASLCGAIIFISSMSMIHELETAETSLGMGWLDMPGMERTLERQQQHGPPTAALWRLQAEAAWVRRDWAAAGLAAAASSRRDPTDARSRNNRAAVLEQQGDRAGARAGYEAAARIVPAAGLPFFAEAGASSADVAAGVQAARYNLARLAGRAFPTTALAARDRPYAAQSAILWARSSLGDLRRVVLPDPSRPAVLRRTIAQLFTGSTAAGLSAVGGGAPIGTPLLRLASTAIASLCLILTLFSLVWLPMPVLLRVPPPPAPSESRWQRAFRALLGLQSPLPHAALLGWLMLVLSLAVPLWAAGDHIGANIVLAQPQLSTVFFDGAHIATATDREVANYGGGLVLSCVVLALALVGHRVWLARRWLKD